MMVVVVVIPRCFYTGNGASLTGQDNVLLLHEFAGTESDIHRPHSAFYDLV